MQLELRVDRHTEVARELVREKQQAKALLVLKKKKLVVKQLDQLGALQINIETMVRQRWRGAQRSTLLGPRQHARSAEAHSLCSRRECWARAAWRLSLLLDHGPGERVAAHRTAALLLVPGGGAVAVQISDVEMSKQQNKLFQVLQQGNEALKQLQKEVRRCSPG